LVEGAVASVDDAKKIRKIRAHCKLLAAMGDCAVTGNVPAMRNPIGPEKILDRAYIENASAQPQIPCVVVPKLLTVVRPIHEYVKVDVYLPGCPPSAATFYSAITALVSGEPLDISALTRSRNIFGVAPAAPELGRAGVALRRFGQSMIEVLANKRIHPGWVVPGGVTEPLSSAKRDQILAMLPEAYANVSLALDAYKKVADQFREKIEVFASFPSNNMSLINEDESIEFTDGEPD